MGECESKCFTNNEKKEEIICQDTIKTNNQY